VNGISFPGAVLIGGIGHGRIRGAVIIRRGSIQVGTGRVLFDIVAAGSPTPGQGQYRHKYDDNHREDKTFPVHNGYFLKSTHQKIMPPGKSRKNTKFVKRGTHPWIS
jgi:hypothetical protein